MGLLFRCKVSNFTKLWNESTFEICLFITNKSLISFKSSRCGCFKRTSFFLDVKPYISRYCLSSTLMRGCLFGLSQRRKNPRMNHNKPQAPAIHLETSISTKSRNFYLCFLERNPRKGSELRVKCYLVSKKCSAIHHNSTWQLQLGY